MAEINLGRPSQKGYPAQRELDKTSTYQRAALARLLLQHGQDANGPIPAQSTL